MGTIDKNNIVNVNLGGKKYEVKLEVCGDSEEHQTVWLQVRQEKGFFYYIVGLDCEGNIVRAPSCQGCGLPMDTRVKDGKVAIKMLK